MKIGRALMGVANQLADWAFRPLLRFFFIEDFFTIKGVLAAAMPLIGLVAAIIGFKILAKPPPIRLERVAVSCVDVAEFVESFKQHPALNPIPETLTAKLLSVLGAAAPRTPNLLGSRIDWSSVTRLDDANSPGRPHVMACWFADGGTSPRTLGLPARRGGMRLRGLLGGSSQVRLTETRQWALEREQVDISPFVQAFPISPATVFEEVREHHPEKRNFPCWPLSETPKHEGFAAHVALNVDIDTLVGAIDQAGLDPDAAQAAYSSLIWSKWTLNIFSVTNDSADATIGHVKLSVRDVGHPEFIEGTLTLGRRAGDLSGEVPLLLPGESRWVVISSFGGALPNSVFQVQAERTPVYTPTWRTFGPLFLVGVLLVLFNIVARKKSFAAYVKKPTKEAQLRRSRPALAPKFFGRRSKRS